MGRADNGEGKHNRRLHGTGRPSIPKVRILHIIMSTSKDLSCGDTKSSGGETRPEQASGHCVPEGVAITHHFRVKFPTPAATISSSSMASPLSTLATTNTTPRNSRKHHALLFRGNGIFWNPASLWARDFPPSDCGNSSS